MIVSVTVTDSREQEIVGALQSVVDRVDLVVVIDTGVRDRTLDLAREVAGDKLYVENHEWIDFSAARNFGLDAARHLGAKWALIVDSDERINFHGEDLREKLESTTADALLVEADNGFYAKEKFIRLASAAHYYGPTHEVLLGGSRDHFRGVSFTELLKTDAALEAKHRRDIPLLKEFIEKNPSDPRWWYYLGFALEGLKERKDAAAAFVRCTTLRRTGEEAAWSAFRAAEQLFALGRTVEAVSIAVKGLGANPTSAECAWIAAEIALNLGENDRAIAWARIAEAVGRYRGCGPDRKQFKYLPALYELPYDVLRRALLNSKERAEAEIDYWLARQARMQALARTRDLDLEWLSISLAVPEEVRYETRSMLRPPKLSEMCSGAKATRIAFDPPGGRLPLNPSVCNHAGQLWCVVRAVNYSMSGRNYTVHDPNGIVRTENYLGQLKLDGTFVNPRLMRDLDKSERYPSHVVGYEDVRLVSVRSGKRPVLTGSATVCDRDPKNSRRIARLHLDAKGDVRSAEVQPSNQLAEKNWMPVCVNGDVAWIYSVDPTCIVPGPLREAPFALDHLRGGAAVEFAGGYLCVMHEAIDEQAGRIYLHRFLRLNRRFEVVAVSQTWVFDHHGIEFCAGIAKTRGGYVISYGLEDREAWIVQISSADLKALRWITPGSD